jgi:hypothetical protein
MSSVPGALVPGQAGGSGYPVATAPDTDFISALQFP